MINLGFALIASSEEFTTKCTKHWTINVNAIDALVAKSDALEQQLGPEYDRVVGGLERVDFNSAEGQQIADVFKAVQEKCE